MGKKNSTLTVSGYLDEISLRGRFYFTFNEVLRHLEIKDSSLRVSLSRLGKAGKIKMVRQGFWIITSKTLGVLHPSYFIDAMMKFLEAKYYVGLISAAAHWGASHQSPMHYYVITDKVMKPIDLGKIKISFVTKTHFPDMRYLRKVSGIGGYFYVSSPELTAIDLMKFSRKSGHLNNVATILDELSELFESKKIVEICHSVDTPTSTIQRLGYTFDRVLEMDKIADLFESCLKDRKYSNIVLSVARKVGDHFDNVPYDSRWGLYINSTVEPD